MIIHHSSMAYRSVQLLDLPDELLLIILRKLHCVDKLYSLEGINKRLDEMVFSKCNTKIIDLANSFMDNDVYLTFDIILDRFCSHILPRIGHNVKSLILQQIFMERVLLACEYPDLHILTIFDFQADSVLRHLKGMNITYN
jgi:hypothetical protein